MTSGTLAGTGEHLLLGRPVTPGGMVLGERPGVRGSYGPEPLYAAAEVPVGEFVYGEALDDRDCWLPPQDLYESTSLQPDYVLDFMEQTEGLESRSASAAPVRAVTGLLRSAAPGGEVTIYDKPFKDWVRGDKVLSFVSQLYVLFGANYRPFRSSGDDPYGTDVRVGWSGSRPFLLIEEAVIIRGAGGRHIVMRQVQAVKTDGPQDVRRAVNRFSARERVRVQALLTHWGATDEERAAILEYADRETVQQDEDVRSLINWERFGPELTRWQKVVQGLSVLTNRVIDSPTMRSLERSIFRRESREA